MDSDFSPDEFTRMCYLVSTYMVGVLKQENVSVLHPGEIFEWGEKPDIMRFVGHDCVHLNDAGEREHHPETVARVQTRAREGGTG